MLKNITSSYVLKKIFDYLKNKRKLKIIKCNRRMLDFLNIVKEDFQVYKTLKEFNEKFSANIEDTNIRELNLMVADIKNKGLEFLNRIKIHKFKNIKFINKWNIKY